MKFPIITKAFKVGTDLSEWKHPDEYAFDIVLAETDGKAKYQYYKEHRFDDIVYIKLKCKREKQYDKVLFENNVISRNDALYRIKHDEWRQEMLTFISINKGKGVYIWSGQWGTYWRENAAGYTSRIYEAGIYEAEEAWKYTSHCGLEKAIKFILVE